MYIYTFYLKTFQNLESVLLISTFNFTRVSFPTSIYTLTDFFFFFLPEVVIDTWRVTSLRAALLVWTGGPSWKRHGRTLFHTIEAQRGSCNFHAMQPVPPPHRPRTWFSFTSLRHSSERRTANSFGRGRTLPAPRRSDHSGKRRRHFILSARHGWLQMRRSSKRGWRRWWWILPCAQLNRRWREIPLMQQ